jgi:hypothetical protein
MRYLTRIPPRCCATTRTTRCVRSGTRCSDVLRALLWLAICLHEGCIGAAAGIPVSLRAVVASLTSRPGVHPLTSIAGDLGLVGEPMLVAALDARCDRTMVPDKFVAPSSADVAGRHMLVIDDVWTTGSNAQSAALTLRGAGAAAVSVLVIGRWFGSAQDVGPEVHSGTIRAPIRRVGVSRHGRPLPTRHWFGEHRPRHRADTGKAAPATGGASRAPCRKTQ